MKLNYSNLTDRSNDETMNPLNTETNRDDTPPPSYVPRLYVPPEHGAPPAYDETKSSKFQADLPPPSEHGAPPVYQDVNIPPHLLEIIGVSVEQEKMDNQEVVYSQATTFIETNLAVTTPKAYLLKAVRSFLATFVGNDHSKASFYTSFMAYMVLLSWWNPIVAIITITEIGIIIAKKMINNYSKEASVATQKILDFHAEMQEVETKHGKLSTEMFKFLNQQLPTQA